MDIGTLEVLQGKLSEGGQPKADKETTWVLIEIAIGLHRIFVQMAKSAGRK